MAKILLVEDNGLNREMLAKRLERSGFVVATAVDGREALAMAELENPDVILMDLDLPEIDGWEATRRLKMNPVTSGIPVIVLTGHTLQQDLRKAVMAGCNHYETKPVVFARLLGKIDGCINRRAAGG